MSACLPEAPNQSVRLGAPRSGRKRWWRNACRETQGDAGKALLRDRGNESLRRRLSEGAPSRGAHAGDGFIVGGSSSRAKTWLENELSVVKSGGKEVSHLEKNSDVRVPSVHLIYYLLYY